MSAAWPSVNLGEVLGLDLDRVAVDPATSYPMVGVLSFGRGLFRREPIENGKTSYRVFYRLRAEHVVMSQLFGWEGALALSSEEFAGRYLSPQFPTFLCDEARLDRPFLGWLMRRPAFWDDLGSRASGMGDRRRTLSPEALFRCRIPLPPFAEQRRIVARITELAAKIEEASTLRRQAAEEAEALGKAGGNTSFSAARDEFGLQRLEETTTRITKGESPEWQGFAYQEDGPLFIRSENVHWGKLDPVNAAHIPEAFHTKLSRSQLKGGDVLINLVGASIGRACVVPPNLGQANVNQAVAVITPNPETLSSEFLVYFLLSPAAQDEIHGGKVETARPNISLGDLRDLKMPVPPLSDQRRIVVHLDELQVELDALKRLQAETAAELDALLPSILDKAFKGEL
jgi:type I restriction enzyme S subunit